VAGIGLFLSLKHMHLDDGAAWLFVWFYINIAAILAAFLFIRGLGCYLRPTLFRFSV
jgi:hypothetical protein